MLRTRRGGKDGGDSDGKSEDTKKNIMVRIFE